MTTEEKNAGSHRGTEALMAHETAEDPVSGLTWTRRTTAGLAEELRGLGIHVCPQTVARLLREMGRLVGRQPQEARRRLESEPRPAVPAQRRFARGLRRGEQLPHQRRYQGEGARRHVPQPRRQVGPQPRTGKRPRLPLRRRRPRRALRHLHARGNAGTVCVGRTADTPAFAVGAAERYPGVAASASAMCRHAVKCGVERRAQQREQPGHCRICPRVPGRRCRSVRRNSWRLARRRTSTRSTRRGVRRRASRRRRIRSWCSPSAARGWCCIAGTCARRRARRRSRRRRHREQLSPFNRLKPGEKKHSKRSRRSLSRPHHPFHPSSTGRVAPAMLVAEPREPSLERRRKRAAPASKTAINLEPVEEMTTLRKKWRDTAQTYAKGTRTDIKNVPERFAHIQANPAGHAVRATENATWTAADLHYENRQTRVADKMPRRHDKHAGDQRLRRRGLRDWMRQTGVDRFIELNEPTQADAVTASAIQIAERGPTGSRTIWSITRDAGVRPGGPERARRPGRRSWRPGRDRTWRPGRVGTANGTGGPPRRERHDGPARHADLSRPCGGPVLPSHRRRVGRGPLRWNARQSGDFDRGYSRIPDFDHTLLDTW